MKNEKLWCPQADDLKNFRRKYHNYSFFISEAASFFIIHFFFRIALGQLGLVFGVDEAHELLAGDGFFHQQELGHFIQQPPVLRHKVHIDGGHNGKHHDSQHGGNQLNQNVLGVAAKFRGVGGAGHADAAEAGGDQA